MDNAETQSKFFAVQKLKYKESIKESCLRLTQIEKKYQVLSKILKEKEIEIIKLKLSLENTQMNSIEDSKISKINTELRKQLAT